MKVEKTFIKALSVKCLFFVWNNAFTAAQPAWIIV